MTLVARAGSVGVNTLVGTALAVQLAGLSSAMAQVMDREVYVFTFFEELEYRCGDTGVAAWDLVGWVGGDIDRFWYKSEGELSTEERSGNADLQLLYGRLVSPFWDLQAGVRAEGAYGSEEERGRAFAVLGIQGLAPGWFDVEAALYVSHEADVSAQLSASYDIRLAQRLLIEPKVELDAAIQEVPEFGVGAGPNVLELGLRLRYELWREFAPYVGVVWERRLLDTATMARAAGEGASELTAAVGFRYWR